MLTYELEDVACNLCGQLETTHLFSKLQWEQGLKAYGALNYVRCKSCGLVYINPRPTVRDLYEIYNHPSPELSGSAIQLSEAEYDFSPEGLYARRLILNRVTKRLCKKKGSLLDLGCGAGAFLAVAGECGWDSYGIDISHACVDYARAEGYMACTGTLEEVHFDTGVFDAVVMLEVLDHLPHPYETLAEVNRILRPGGVVYTGSQNFASLTIAAWGREWRYIGLHHLYYFTPETLCLLLRSTGFEVQELFFDRVNLLAIWNAIKARLGHSRVQATSPRDALVVERETIHALRRRWWAPIVSGIMKTVAQISQRGDTVYALARKQSAPTPQ